MFPGHDTAKNKARELAKDAGKCDDKGLYENTDQYNIWELRLKDKAGQNDPVWVVRAAPYYGAK